MYNINQWSHFAKTAQKMCSKKHVFDFSLTPAWIYVLSLQLEEVLCLRRMAALLTTCWLTSEKVSSLERPGPGAKRKVPPLVKCIGTPVRKRQLGPLRNGSSPNAWNYFPFSSPLLHDHHGWMAVIVPDSKGSFWFISVTKGDWKIEKFFRLLVREY